MEQAGYYEPSLEILLPLAAFPLLLHIVAWPLNKLISCGLLGQIVVGMIFGAPLTQWLGDETYATVLQLGYIGLILLVYEGKRTPRLQMFSVCCFEKIHGANVGGLETNLYLLKQAFVPSIVVALTGILLPISLSFLLIKIVQPTKINLITAFTAGASLSSTSLGTTFAILQQAQLASTRLGTVLVTAAMLDDIVGLVMVKVITSIRGNVSVNTITRPIYVSIIAVAVVWFGAVAVKAGWQKAESVFHGKERWRIRGFGFVVVGVTILGFTAAAGYAGTSILFSSYLAGVASAYVSDGKARKSYERFEL